MPRSVLSDAQTVTVMFRHSDAPVRYLVVSTTNCPDIVEYPDTGATLVVLAEQRLAYPHGADAHQTRVITEAMRAADDIATFESRRPAWMPTA